ncbi:MAG: hypothetical protein OSA77_12950 [Halioglobus sp.]|nr:hypothetical protein [Halioglobus sp.]
MFLHYEYGDDNDNDKNDRQAGTGSRTGRASSSQRQLRKDLDDWLPELKRLTSQEREMVDAIASFEHWNRLREHQKLNKKTSTRLVTRLMHRIILND